MSDNLKCIDCGRRNASLKVIDDRWHIACPDCEEARWISADYLTPKSDLGPDQYGAPGGEMAAAILAKPYNPSALKS